MTQNFKKLFLDESKIEGAVRSFSDVAKIIGPNARGQFTEYEIFIEGQEVAKLHVYACNDSTFTLSASVGKNTPLSQQVAAHVAEKCKRKAYEQRPFSLERISEDDWKFLLEHLEHDYGFAVTEGAVPHGVRFDVKKAHNDYVNLNRYTKSGKLLMQGKSREVYATVVEVLSDHLADKRELVEAQLKTYNVQDVKAEDLFAELRQHVPSAMNLLGETGAAVISPALALAKLDIDLPDYSCVAYHALRGLELYIKAIMAKHGCPVQNHTGFGNYLAAGNAQLKIGVRAKMTPEEATAIEDGYAMLKTDRNELFHADANPEMSRILPDKVEAAAILHTVLELIERTAAAIPDHAR
ncbi:RNase LS family HEPN domain-containing protein [Massilia aurea]|uniref:RNase LS family HEPN domain-containing protein n=1 Tax=Massilia aurea TaxID=373040 RepID=UPI0021625D5D|nr:RNase LS family HEPN domain-containing protein [Massilia aurea]MCS0710069.1 RNase LS family HEPN domain-containing protein [Massilia aurea]